MRHCIGVTSCASSTMTCAYSVRSCASRSARSRCDSSRTGISSSRPVSWSSGSSSRFFRGRAGAPRIAWSSSSMAMSCTEYPSRRSERATLRISPGFRTRRAQRPSRFSSAMAASTAFGVSSGHQASRKAMKESSLAMSSSKEERSSAASSGSVCRPAAPERSHRASRSSLRARGRSRLTGAVPPRAVRRTRSSSSASSSRRRPKATTRRRPGGVVTVSSPGACAGAAGPSSRAPRAAFRSTFSIRYEPLARATAGESYSVASAPSTSEPIARIATWPSSPSEGSTPSV